MFLEPFASQSETGVLTLRASLLLTSACVTACPRACQFNFVVERVHHCSSARVPLLGSRRASRRRTSSARYLPVGNASWASRKLIHASAASLRHHAIRAGRATRRSQSTRPTSFTRGSPWPTIFARVPLLGSRRVSRRRTSSARYRPVGKGSRPRTSYAGYPPVGNASWASRKVIHASAASLRHHNRRLPENSGPIPFAFPRRERLQFPGRTGPLG